MKIKFLILNLNKFCYGRLKPNQTIAELTEEMTSIVSIELKTKVKLIRCRN